MKERTFSKLKVVIMVVIVAIIAIFGTYFSCFNDHTYIATITDKDRIVESNEGEIDSYYLIFCKDDEGNYYEFKNEDLLIRGKVKSSNVQNKLEVGKTYQFTVVGFRLGLFSWYENIIKFEQVK